MENCPIVLLNGTYLPVALVAFVIHNYILLRSDSMRKR